MQELKLAFGYVTGRFRYLVPLVVVASMLVVHGAASAKRGEMMVRISKIEIHSDHLEDYKSILKEEAQASVRLEPGVIAIFPMYQQPYPTQVRILEIYASHKAYEAHLKTPHFQRYKTTTLNMVKSLELVDMQPIDTETMTRMFSKMK